MVRLRKRPRKFGPAFGDMVLKHVASKNNKSDHREGDFYSFWSNLIFGKTLSDSQEIKDTRRITPFFILVLVVFGLLLARLFFLQIVEGEENLNRSEVNRIQFRTIHAPRGAIYDKDGQLLARSTAAFRLIKGEDIQIIDKDTALTLEAQKLISEGLVEGELGKLEIDTLRQYLQGQAFAHILGYVSQVSADELEMERYEEYVPGDRIGRLGIEEAFESRLRGQDGRELIETDAKGQKLGILGTEDPKSGHNLRLTLDASLQSQAFQSLSKAATKHNSKGAVVVQDPKTGAILALSSYPSFDNNIFSDPKLSDKYQEYASDLRLPFLNRATLGLYPPGSIFKIVSALAGLESGKVTSQTQIEDVGEIFLGPYRFANWYFESYGKKEGLLNIVRAIARSNDVFFYRVGQFVGEKLLAEMAFKLNLGKKTGIDLPSEEKGLIPTAEWKKAVKGEIWLPGNTLHMAIGQGDVLTTPLQVANLTSYIASGGLLFQPYIVSEITDENEKVIKKIDPKILSKDLVSKNNLDLVKEGMRQSCETGGTGWPFFDFSVRKFNNGEVIRVPVGCKTGTAEFGIVNPHAWFTVFAPFDNPEIVVTVILEEAGEGSSVAAPVAKEILSWYFSNK